MSSLVQVVGKIQVLEVLGQRGPVSSLAVSGGPPSGPRGHSPVLACGPVSRQASSDAASTSHAADLTPSSAPSVSLAFKAAGVIQLGPPGALPVITPTWKAALSLGHGISEAVFSILPPPPTERFQS